MADGHRLDLAREVGAHEVLLPDGQAAGTIREMTDGRGAGGLRLRGAAPTVDLAPQVAGTMAEVFLVKTVRDEGALAVVVGVVGRSDGG